MKTIPRKISKQAIRIPKSQPKKLRIVRNGKDGKTPTKEELLEMIKPLIPEIPQKVVKNTPKKALIRLIEEYIANKPLTAPTVDFGMKETDAGTEVTINGVTHLIPRAVYGPKLRNFLQMGDTPDSYQGQAGKSVVVNSDENALEFKDITVPPDTDTLQSVTDRGRYTDKMDAPLSAGCVSMDSITDNGDGSVTTGNHICNLFLNADGSGGIQTFTIPGGTFTLTDLINNYIVADYNGGSPIIRATTDVNEINETTIIPLWTIFREGLILHELDWDKLGLALSNKLNQRLVKTERFARQNGLSLSTSGRTVFVTQGTVWYGAAHIDLTSVDSSTDEFSFYYHTAGVWTKETITEFPNLYYDDGTDRQTLGTNKYGAVFIYRGVESDKHIFCVLDGESTNLASAQNAQPPSSLPPAIAAHAILVGRIIFQKSASDATQVDSAFNTTFSPSGASVSLNKTLQLTGNLRQEYAQSPYKVLIDMESAVSTFPSGISITSIYVKCLTSADPTTELAGKIRYCDGIGTGAFPGANVTDIATIDTTTGNYSQTGMTSTVPAGKILYLEMTANPTDYLTNWSIIINFNIL